MKIKRYIADSLPQAIQQIRQELGENAVVLNTKEMRIGGFLGFFQKRKLEVIAALEVSGAKQEVEDLVKKKQEPEGEFPDSSSKEILNRLNEMEGLLKGLTFQQKPKASSNLEKWMSRLEKQEVDQEVIEFLIRKLRGLFPNIEARSENEIETALLEAIVSLFEEGIATSGLGESARVVTLIGPTGVGKTTTIAKLASRQVLYQRKKVGLLTADTFRIAAIDQLRTYATILNLPIVVVESPEGLKESMAQLKNSQMIFMDSTGRNYLDEQYVEEINEYLSQQLTQENHLVLSMTSRWQDMKQIVEKMQAVPVDKIILTKWDESTCYGAALNLVFHYPYPLSFISLGQGVPEDIMMAEPNYMARKILGVGEDEAGSSTEASRIISAI